MKARLVAFLSLFTSAGTLVCCALPALFVALGMGAAFAGLLNVFPQLIWVSENKGAVFSVGGVLLALAGFLRWKARRGACPTDPEKAAACSTARDWSNWAYGVSVAFYLLGALFAYVLPLVVKR